MSDRSPVNGANGAASRIGASAVRASCPVIEAIAATRALMILRYAGVDDVRLLDGGYDWWVQGGNPLETVLRTPTPVDAFGVTGTLQTSSVDETTSDYLASRQPTRRFIALEAVGAMAAEIREGKCPNRDGERLEPLFGGAHMIGDDGHGCDRIVADIVFCGRQQF